MRINDFLDGTGGFKDWLWCLGAVIVLPIIWIIGNIFKLISFFKKEI